MVVTSGNSTFRIKPRLSIQPLLIFLVRYKILHARKNSVRNYESCTGSYFFKKAVRLSATIKISEGFPIKFGVSKSFSMKWGYQWMPFVWHQSWHRSVSSLKNSTDVSLPENICQNKSWEIPVISERQLGLSMIWGQCMMQWRGHDIIYFFGGFVFVNSFPHCKH